MDLYRYRPLSGPDKIRVLYPLTFGGGTQPSFMMVEHGLHSKDADAKDLEDSKHSDNEQAETLEEFIALSYTWGSPEPLCHVLINGRLKQVTQNLCDALTTLLRSNYSGGIWADAICIHQEDNTEKTQQVAMMREIYSRATSTWVWLGQSWPGIDDALQSITIYANVSTLLKVVGASNVEDYSSFLRKIEAAIEESAVQSFTDLLERFAWFERAWIVQEVVVNGNVVMNCGDYRWSWEKFHEACMGFLTCRQATSDLAIRRRTQAFNIGSLRDRTNTDQSSISQGPVLIDILRQFHSCQATDPRDNVFAFSGLAADGRHPDLTPDYTKTFLQIYREFSKHYLMETDQMYDDHRLLSPPEHHGTSIRAGPALRCFGIRLLHWASGLENGGDLPSWAVDWRSPSKFYFQDASGTKTYCAAGNLHKVVETTPNDLDIIRIGGFRLATIADISCPLLSRGEDSRNVPLEELNRLLGKGGEWESLANTVGFAGKYVPTGEYMDTVVRDTMVFDTLPWKNRIPPELASPFWKNHLEGFDQRAAEADRTGLVPFDEKSFSEYLQQKKAYCLNRRLAVTNNGYIGLVPSTARAGDKVCVLFGAETPFVLRPEGSDFRLIGDAYIHGVMDGEALIHAAGQQVPKFTHDEEDEMSDVIEDILNYRQGFVRYSNILMEMDISKLNISWEIFPLR